MSGGSLVRSLIPSTGSLCSVGGSGCCSWGHGIPCLPSLVCSCPGSTEIWISELYGMIPFQFSSRDNQHISSAHPPKSESYTTDQLLPTFYNLGLMIIPPQHSHYYFQDMYFYNYVQTLQWTLYSSWQ